jgi:hypothetical protein
MGLAHILMALFLLVSPCLPARADWNTEYQFGTSVAAPPGDPLLWASMSAFLWVPPSAPHIRAVVLAPANIIERRFCDDPIIRAEAARDQIAIVFMQPAWRDTAMSTPALTTNIQTILNQLAATSGYSEIATAPWIPVGHSGNSQFCADIARLNPGRILANVIIKGALITPDKDGSTAGLVGIPTLFFTGQFEEVMPPGKVRDAWWGVSMTRFAADRVAVPDCLVDGMEDKSHGHINFFPDMLNYAALFIHKAVAARLGAHYTVGETLRTLPFASGWLTDPTETYPSAPVALYKGDPTKAFWNFDGEQARAWEVQFRRDEGKKEQLLAFTQDGEIAPLWPGWGLQALKFEPLSDGESFRADAVFRDAVPAPFADAGTPVGHSISGTIKYMILGWAGASIQTGLNTFRVHFDREGVNGRTVHILVGAYHPGDAQYRETIAVGSFDVPYHNDAGTKQTITFPEIADVAAGTQSIPLSATVDSGLKPDYYVSYGPAVIDGDHIKFTPLPVKAKYPIEVKVTAYQWGTATTPFYASAKPITQTFHIVR